MAERAARPANANGGAASAPSFPPTKSQLYNANRPVYRPQPAKRRRRSSRGCCCSCCLWLTFILIGLVLLAAIVGAVFYFIYRPHRPSFSVTALQLSSFNISSPANLLSSRLDINITAHNPNKRLVYLYDPISISAFTGDVAIGSGSLLGFSHDAGNTTYLHAAVVASGLPVDSAAAADLRKKGSLALEIFLESKAGVKVGGAKTKKIGVRVRCSGVDVGVPKGKKSAAAALPASASCEVKLRVKIWKWYL